MIDYVLDKTGNNDLDPSIASRLIIILKELSSKDINIKLMYANIYIVKFITSILDLHN